MCVCVRIGVCVCVCVCVCICRMMDVFVEIRIVSMCVYVEVLGGKPVYVI